MNNKPIRMDGKYRTRSGLPVRVLLVDRAAKGYPVVAVVMEHGTEVIHTYTAAGRASEYRLVSDDDLIEIVEPTITSVWTNVYKTLGTTGKSHSSRARADAASYRARLNVLRRDTVTWPDGRVEYKLTLESENV